MAGSGWWIFSEGSGISLLCRPPIPALRTPRATSGSTWSASGIGTTLTSCTDRKSTRLCDLDFLRRVWNLSSLPSADSRFENAEGDIWQHMVSFRDWDYSYLLYDYLDILRSPDELFGKFLETCLHPLVVPDPYQAVPLCQDINARLRADGFELKPGPPISGRPVFKLQTVESQSPTEGEGGSHYEVVLSFAGEEREYVEEVAQILAASGVLVFYDKFERATLWSKDLSEHLHTVYAGSARYCVM